MGTAAVAYIALFASRLPCFCEGRHPLPRMLDKFGVFSKNILNFEKKNVPSIDVINMHSKFHKDQKRKGEIGKVKKT